MRSASERNAVLEREERLRLVVERPGRTRRLALGSVIVVLVVLVVVVAVGPLH